MSLVKEIPVLVVSRQLEISDKRLWRFINYLKVMLAVVFKKALLKPIGKAHTTLERPAERSQSLVERAT
ncbi:hypothetical protein [Halomonas sp. ISL-56]|uniref:hypothetical protein n=1 Tax=Halomonas sp. ISL-56 TaxID=2819149 RepID=UPI0020357057|nr:hypothetical protein [Halomonas sp. ISL-56]